MSLLSKTTSTQLGIGGDVRDFGAGVTSRKKKGVQLTPAQLQAQQGANEAGDARLKAQSDVKGQYDPKAAKGASLMLTTDDEAFITAVKDLESQLFSGQYIGVGGARKDIGNFLAAADLSSRGGLGDIWNDVIADLSKGAIGPKKLAALQEKFTSAYASTSEVLNLDVDLARYDFDPGKGGEQLQVGRSDRTTGNRTIDREVQAGTRERSLAAEGVSKTARGTFAWDLAAQAGDELAIGTGASSGGLAIR